jgi:hypothetical protein
MGASRGFPTSISWTVRMCFARASDLVNDLSHSWKWLGRVGGIGEGGGLWGVGGYLVRYSRMVFLLCGNVNGRLKQIERSE